MKGKTVKISLMLVIIVAVSCGYIAYQKDSQPTLERIEMSVSWARLYDNVTQLANYSDLIIVGEIVTADSYNEQVVPYDTPGNTMVFTDYMIEINQIIRGKSETREITVHQTGGVIDNKMHVVSDDPLLLTEKTVILFLTRYEPNKYFITGGPQGQFYYIDSKVYSIGELDSTASDTTQVMHTKGLSLEAFTNFIN